MGGGGQTGEGVVRNVLRMLVDYLQTIQQYQHAGRAALFWAQQRVAEGILHQTGMFFAKV
jgi:hypothetical protein